MKKTIYYWSPFLTKVGTVKSTLNSAISLAKFSNDYNVIIINIFGEWTKYKNYLEKNDIKLKNLTFNYYNLLPKTGFFKSRFSYIAIILISLFPFLFFYLLKGYYSYTHNTRVKKCVNSILEI